ncbi:MAG: hypothetical protein RRY23_04335 [Alistipes sp.]
MKAEDNTINSAKIADYILGLEARYSALSAQLQEATENNVNAANFYAVVMTTDEVAKFHKVSPARVRDYATRGLIELHPNSTDAKLLFRASVVLTLRFETLKQTKLYLKR